MRFSQTLMRGGKIAVRLDVADDKKITGVAPMEVVSQDTAKQRGTQLTRKRVEGE